MAVSIALDSHSVIHSLTLPSFFSTRSRTIRNTTSARASVPGLLVEEPSDSSKPWKWRTDLAETKPFWEGWFTGLSKKFLEASGGKLLLLAGTDRLDKELTIGQMQGMLHEFYSTLNVQYMMANKYTS